MAETSSSEISVRWMWKSNADPWSTTELEEWRSYSDIEISVIEEAHKGKEPSVILNDYHINFYKSVQISNNNQNNQRPIKRVVAKEGEELSSLCQQRFQTNPIHPSAPFRTSSWFFTDEVEKYFNIDKLYNEWGFLVVLEMMVQEAAKGLLVEGIHAGCQQQAESMVIELLQVKKGTPKEVTACCARLYCRESFLFKKLNECMRLIGDEGYEQMWKEKARTLGPFAWLLEQLPNPYTDQNMTVYRSATLSDDSIEQFRH